MDALLLDGQPVVRTADVAGWLDSLGFDDLGTLMRELEPSPVVLPGCTGYLDEEHDGQLVHDGDTCPVHEDPPALARPVLEDALSHLSTYLAQAKQHGIPLTLGDDDTGRGLLEHAVARVDEAYALLEAASGTARVTAGPSPGRVAEHRGVRAWVTLEDRPESANYLVFQAFIDPPPIGLDRLAYSHQAVRVPPEHRV